MEKSIKHPTRENIKKAWEKAKEREIIEAQKRALVTNQPVDKRKKHFLPFLFLTFCFCVLGGTLFFAYNRGLFDNLLGRKAIKVIDNQNGVKKIYTLSPEASRASKEALKSLEKIEFFTTKGVNFMAYDLAVTEAEPKVNDATKQLPKGELKEKFEAAIKIYSGAREDWRKGIQDGTLPDYLKRDNDYEAERKAKQAREDFAEGKTDFPMPKDFGIKLFWLFAAQEVNNISLFILSQEM